jgi:hypothetical protein
MSQAFMREREEEWLGNVNPTIEALSRYLTKENNGVPVYEVKRYHSKEQGREVYEMSNGEHYALDMDKRWYMV